jgi:hypothetical protein
MVVGVRVSQLKLDTTHKTLNQRTDHAKHWLPARISPDAQVTVTSQLGFTSTMRVWMATAGPKIKNAATRVDNVANAHSNLNAADSYPADPPCAFFATGLAQDPPCILIVERPIPIQRLRRRRSNPHNAECSITPGTVLPSPAAFLIYALRSRLSHHGVKTRFSREDKPGRLPPCRPGSLHLTD